MSIDIESPDYCPQCGETPESCGCDDRTYDELFCDQCGYELVYCVCTGTTKEEVNG